MTQLLVSSCSAVNCLRYIEEFGPITAIDLANKIGIAGERETKRRQVREIVKHLREEGQMIVADLQGGYFKTDDVKEWQAYLDGRQMGAKRVLGITHQQLKMVTDGKNQGLLFVPGGATE